MPPARSTILVYSHILHNNRIVLTRCCEPSLSAACGGVKVRGYVSSYITVYKYIQVKIKFTTDHIPSCLLSGSLLLTWPGPLPATSYPALLTSVCFTLSLQQQFNYIPDRIVTLEVTWWGRSTLLFVLGPFYKCRGPLISSHGCGAV